MSCGNCGKIFSNKAGLSSHLRRKEKCSPPDEVIEPVMDDNVVNKIDEPVVVDDTKITKTLAKKEYMLNDADLENIKCESYETRKYGRRQTITLYKTTDLLKAALVKYPDFNLRVKEKKRKLDLKKKHAEEVEQTRLENIKFRTDEIELILAKKDYNKTSYNYILTHGGVCSYIKNGFDDETKTMAELNLHLDKAHCEYLEINARRQTIILELGKIGLELRDDSKLCHAYINGGLESVKELTGENYSVVDIINSCAEMHFLHTYTKYKIIVDNEIAKEKREMREYGRWYDGEHIDIPNILEYSKGIAIRSYVSNNKGSPNIPNHIYKKYKIKQ
jgi:hypothetical protein